jgi:hypothetical protein
MSSSVHEPMENKTRASKILKISKLGFYASLINSLAVPATLLMGAAMTNIGHGPYTDEGEYVILFGFIFLAVAILVLIASTILAVVGWCIARKFPWWLSIEIPMLVTVVTVVVWIYYLSF